MSAPAPTPPCSARRWRRRIRNLYRTAQGLIEAVPAENKVRVIDSARKLAPVLIDRLDIKVMRGGKIVGDLPPERSLNALLGSEQFLAVLQARGCRDVLPRLPRRLHPGPGRLPRWRTRPAHPLPGTAGPNR